ncbi:Sodium/potassium-transporting ATPase subunit beta-1 [Taenia crassiceps]
MLSLTYFLLFYIVLAAFFFGYINALMYFDIDRDRPALTGPSSALGFNPGLSIVPRPDLYSSLIRTTSRSIEVYEGFTSELMAFLDPYQRFADRVEMMQCAKDDGSYRFDRTRPCAFDLNSAWPCNMDSVFGYDGESPCILLKMNKVYGWLPDPVEGATGVVVKCEGVTKDDHFNLGKIRYYDLEHHYTSKGWEALIEGKADNGTFHADFFPYVNQKWYLQPIVWVVFREMQRDSYTRVQCYLIAKNIHVDLKSGEGSIRFELLVE